MKVPLKRSHWNGSPFLKRFFPTEGHVMVKQRSVFFKNLLSLTCAFMKRQGGAFAWENHMTYIGKLKHTIQEASLSNTILLAIIAFWGTSISYEPVNFL